MAKLTFAQDFTLEVGDKTYTGTFAELTKAQRKDLKTKQKGIEVFSTELNKILAKMKTVERKIEIKENLEDWENVYSLNEELAKLRLEAEQKTESFKDKAPEETIYKNRLMISLGGDDKEEIIKLCEEYGYKIVLETIQKDISEKKN